MYLNYQSVPKKKLQSSISPSATSFQLNNILSWDGATDLTSADFGDVAYAVFQDNLRTKMEIMLIDPSTIADSSITITARGLNYDGTIDDTEHAGLKLSWTSGDTIVQLGSNPPQLYAQFVNLAETQTITGTKTFTTATRPLLTADGDTTTDTHFITYGQLYRTALVGAVDADETHKGLVELATAAETLAGTDAGSTSAYLFAKPSQIAKNVQNSVYSYANGAGLFNAAFLTGDTGAEGTFGTWAAVSDASFRITIDGVAYNIDAIDFTGAGSMAAVATIIQTAIQTATGNLETCTWSTDHFIISSVDTTLTSAITVTDTSTGTVGTDISGAGGSDWMDCDATNGVVTDRVLVGYNVTLTPAIGAYQAGQRFIFLADDTNTGATNINFNAISNKNLFKYEDQELEAGDIEANSIVEVVYDGVSFQLQTPVATTPTTAINTEMSTFFGATDITGAEAETLTDLSDADTLHTHGEFNFTPNTSIDKVSYITNSVIIPATAILGWTHATQTVANSAIMTRLRNASAGSSYIALEEVGNGSLVQFDQTQIYRIKVVAKFLAGVSGGFGLVNSSNQVNSAEDSTDKSIRFYCKAGVLYSVNGDGSANTNNDIDLGITDTDDNVYELVWNPGTDVKFYINGDLKATHTTNIPSGADDVYLSFGRSAGEAMTVSNITISREI